MPRYQGLPASPGIAIGPALIYRTHKVTFTEQRVDDPPAEWQTAPILVNPPSLNFTAVLMVADLHGRMGFFPAFLRLRPVEGAIPPRFEVAEVMNLQSIREKARLRRVEPKEE